MPYDPRWYGVSDPALHGRHCRRFSKCGGRGLTSSIKSRSRMVLPLRVDDANFLPRKIRCLTSVLDHDISKHTFCFLGHHRALCFKEKIDAIIIMGQRFIIPLSLGND